MADRCCSLCIRNPKTCTCSKPIVSLRISSWVAAFKVSAECEFQLPRKPHAYSTSKRRHRSSFVDQERVATAARRAPSRSRTLGMHVSASEEGGRKAKHLRRPHTLHVALKPLIELRSSHCVILIYLQLICTMTSLLCMRLPPVLKNTLHDGSRKSVLYLSLGSRYAQVRTREREVGPRRRKQQATEVDSRDLRQRAADCSASQIAIARSGRVGAGGLPRELRLRPKGRTGVIDGHGRCTRGTRGGHVLC